MNNKRNLIIGAVVVVLVAIVLTGVFSDKSGNIKIGNSSALSGSLAYLGEADTNGLILASEEINKAGGINGRMIEVISEDNQGDPKVAVSVAQKLLDIDKVDVMFSGRTNLTQAIATIVQSAGKPMFYSSNDGSIAEKGINFFRDSFDAEQSGKAIAKKVMENGYTSVKLISEQSEVCKIYSDAVKVELKNLGLTVSAEEFFQSNTTDMRSNLTKLSLKSDDALVACAWRHAHILIKNLSELGNISTQTFQYTAPTFPVADTAEMKQLFSKNQTISTWYGFSELGNTERQNEFIEKYKARFGKAPAPLAPYTYDDVYIMKGAFEKCFDGSGLDNDCFAKEIKSKEHDGVVGKVSFDSKGRSNRDVLMIQAKSGVWNVIR